MNRSRLSAGALVGGLILAGCEKPEAGAPATNANPNSASKATNNALPATTVSSPQKINPEAANPMDVQLLGKCFGVGLAVPRLAAGSVYSSRSMIVEAIYFATAQSGAGLAGQVRTTGTITVSELGAQYSPSPSDRLIAQLGTQVHEFKLKNAQGNNNADSAISWLGNPHVLEYSHTLTNQAEANITVQFDGNNFATRVNGWSMLAGNRYDVDLLAQGSTRGVSDLDGQERKTQYQLTGTVKGPGVEVTVLEQHVLNMASATSLRLLHSQRGSATQIQSVVDSTMKCGGHTYRFDHVQTETGSKEKGFQSSGGIVAASGRVLRDDRPFGELALVNGTLVVAAGGGAIPVQLGQNSGGGNPQ